MNLVDNRYVCSPCYSERKKPLLRRKSPGWTVVLNALPGAGYLYLGQHIKGLIVFLSFLAAAKLEEPILIMGTLAYAFIDGFRQARFMNADLYQEPQPLEEKGRLTLGIALVILGSLLILGNLYGSTLEILQHIWPLALVAVGAWQIHVVMKNKSEKKKPETDTVNTENS